MMGYSRRMDELLGRLNVDESLTIDDYLGLVGVCMDQACLEVSEQRRVLEALPKRVEPCGYCRQLCEPAAVDGWCRRCKEDQEDQVCKVARSVHEDVHAAIGSYVWRESGRSVRF